MPYIGNQIGVGNFVKLDAITTSATTTFALTNGGVAYYPQSPNHCLVSLNGILQAPTDSFTISGSNIVFSSALTTSDVIDFIIVLGDVLNIGTPSDNTVSLAKLTATGTKDATTFLRGDNTFAEAGGGKLLQVVQTTKTNTFSTTSSSYVDVTGLSVSITPSSTSNKVLVLAQISGGGAWTVGRLLRGSTSIIEATSDGASRTEGTFSLQSSSTAKIVMASVIYLDSPSTTSSTTYKIQILSPDGATAGINRSEDDSDVNYQLRTTSTITAIEIKG